MGFHELAGWIPQTKLTPPCLRGDIVPRPQLLESLRQAVTAHALTLIAAPAGYGKTTLLVAFAQAPAPMPVAWFAIDEQDDDPGLFLAGLVAAIRLRCPGCGQRTQALLTQPAPPAQQAAAALINDLLAALATPTLLVLDDLHLVRDPAIYDLLAYLVEHLPPLLRMVVATRHDPPLALPRWRARGLLAELRLAQLSFSAAEAAALLNGQLRLRLGAADLAALWQNTEGWVAGLRLLAGSLEHQPHGAGGTRLPQHLAQGHRAVAEVLLDEVLNRQEPAVRSFLLATAILDELTPALCMAVTGRPDAEALLETLYRRNLFLIALRNAAPGAPPSYRYHALFSGFLRRQLAREAEPDEIAALHHVAADAEPVAARAIQHLLAAEAWGAAIRRIEQEGGLLMRRGLRRTIEGWIAALPAGMAETRPRLCYLLGVIAWQQGQIAAADIWLQRAADGFAASGDLTGQGEALIDLVVSIFWRSDLARGQAMTRQALELPLLPRSRLHGQLMLFALSLYWRAQGDPTREALSEVTALVRASADPEALTIVLAASHPLAASCLDSLDMLAVFFQEALAQIQDELSPARIGALAAQAAISLMHGRLEEALDLVRLAQAVSAQVGGYIFIDAPAAALCAYVHMAAGRYDEAAQELRRGLDELPRLALADLDLAAQLYVLGRLCWLRGEPAGMRQVYARMQALAHADELPVAPLARALMGGLLALAEGRLAAAERLLLEVAAQEERVGLLALYGSAHPLLAHLALLRGRPAEALAALAPWLAACARYDTPGRILQEGAYVRPLLQLAGAHGLQAAFVARTLDLLPEERPAAVRVPATGETLTPREVEVLRLLAQGVTNKAIAEQLVIGTQTAKTHVARILGKLGAATRTEAVARAYALGIIEPG